MHVKKVTLSSLAPEALSQTARTLVVNSSVSDQSVVIHAALRDVSIFYFSAGWDLSREQQRYPESSILIADPSRPDGCPGGNFCLTQGYCCPDVSPPPSYHPLPPSNQPLFHPQPPIPSSPPLSPLHPPFTKTPPPGRRPRNLRPPKRRHPPSQLRRRPDRRCRRSSLYLRCSNPYDCPLNFRRIASDHISLAPPSRLQYPCRILNRVIRASVPSSFQRDAAICAGGRGDSFYGGGGEGERRCFGGAGGCGCVVALRVWVLGGRGETGYGWKVRRMVVMV